MEILTIFPSSNPWFIKYSGPSREFRHLTAPPSSRLFGCWGLARYLDFVRQVESGVELQGALQIGNSPDLYSEFYMFPKDPWDWYIYLHEWLIFMVNVAIYTIHGSYGVETPLVKLRTEKQGQL